MRSIATIATFPALPRDAHLGYGLIISLRFSFENLTRHNTASGHTEALEAYCHRLRAQAAQGAGEFVSTFAMGAQATGAQNARAHLAKRPRERSGPPSLEEFRVAQ